MSAKIILATVLLLLCLKVIGEGLRADAADDKARAALNAYLAKVPGAQAGRVLALTDGDVIHAFPSEHFYVVRFRGYPVKPPDSFKNSNLFAIAADNTVKRLADEKALKEFFRAFLPPVTNDADAKAALVAWLRMAEELYQDGYYVFKPVKDSMAVRSRDDKHIVSGKVRVTEGGEGEITAKLTFARDGKLVEASTKATLKPSGARPAGARP